MAVIFPKNLIPNFGATIDHDVGATHEEVNNLVVQQPKTVNPMVLMVLKFGPLNASRYQELMGFVLGAALTDATQINIAGEEYIGTFEKKISSKSIGDHWEVSLRFMGRPY